MKKQQQKEEEKETKVVFTGIQPTGTLTLGHYCGIINNILKKQETSEIIVMIADIHALTVPEKN